MRDSAKVGGFFVVEVGGGEDRAAAMCLLPSDTFIAMLAFFNCKHYLGLFSKHRRFQCTKKPLSPRAAKPAAMPSPPKSGKTSPAERQSPDGRAICLWPPMRASSS
jgi:hypothetical protein